MATDALTARSRRTRSALVSAVHRRLVADGRFTADDVARDAGCTPGTFWSHFSTKDDATTQAFELALGELEALATTLFEEHPALTDREAPALLEWSRRAVDQVVVYFTENALIYRSTLARIPEHRPILHCLRDAEARITAIVSAGLDPNAPDDDARSVVVFLQGLNNPALLARRSSDRTAEQLARALATLVVSRP